MSLDKGVQCTSITFDTVNILSFQNLYSLKFYCKSLQEGNGLIKTPKCVCTHQLRQSLVLEWLPHEKLVLQTIACRYYHIPSFNQKLI